MLPKQLDYAETGGNAGVEMTVELIALIAIENGTHEDCRTVGSENISKIIK